MRPDPQLDNIYKIAERLKALERRLRMIDDVEVTPNDMAAMLEGSFTSEGAQSIPNDSWTYVDFDFSSGGTWDLGLGIDDGHDGGDNIDRIRVDGIPGETVINFSLEVAFASNATGIRGLAWVAGDGSEAHYTMPALSGIETAWSDTHRRRQPLGDEWYSVKVLQTSGGALNLDFMNFIAWRIR